MKAFPPVETRWGRPFRRANAWWYGGIIAALTPKCALCLMAYAGVGASLGFNGPEWCGTAEDSSGFAATAAAWLGVFGFLLLGLRRLITNGQARPKRNASLEAVKSTAAHELTGSKSLDENFAATHDG